MTDNVINFEKHKKARDEKSYHDAIERPDLEIAADLIANEMNMGIANMFSSFDIDIMHPDREVDGKHLQRMVRKIVLDHFSVGD